MEGLPSGGPVYNWIYRGQQDSNWPIAPTIERLLGTDAVAENECALYEGFVAKAGIYESRLPRPGDAFSWTALMRHHGCPTRLVDWTYSPFVAAYFALQGAQESNSAAIWALSLSEFKNKHWWATKAGVREGQDSGLRVALDPEFTLYATERHEGLIRIFTPATESLRASAQQGCFLYNCNLNMSFEASLAEMMQSNSAWLYRILIPGQLRPEFLKRLMWMNVHGLSLFPDLDGLSRFLALKLEILGV
jgi:hypothetical protein